MKIKLLIILIFIFLLSFNSVFAIGVGANVSFLDLELDLGQIKETKILVSNISQEPGIFQVFADELNDWFKIEPNNFRLEAGENKEVKIIILAKEKGKKITNLSILANPLSRFSFSVGSGIKIPLNLSINDKSEMFLAALSRILRQGLSLRILGFLVTCLIGIFLLKYLKQRITFKSMNKRKIILAIFIIIFGAIFRILLNEIIRIPNFEAVTALTLLSGSFFGGIFVVFIPLLIIFLSDLYFGNAIVYFFTWSAFILIGIFGTLIKRNSKYYYLKMMGGGIGAVLFFYLLTNFGWWLTFGMYPMTFSGLLQCYIAGLPFLKNQLISVLIFVPVFLPIFSFAFRKVLIKRTPLIGEGSGEPSGSPV